MNKLKSTDPAIAELIQQEDLRQKNTIDLIASENYCPEEILEALSSNLINKYAEGYPKNRYYSGCEIVDQIETMAIERCKELFKAEHANVQPHSGSTANMAVFNAILNPGDKILSMSLSSGGHLTHGHSANFSGKLYDIIHYGVHKDTQLLDYEEIEQLAETYKPKLIIAGASAYPRAIDFSRFSEISKKINAYFMADIAHIAGLIAVDLHPSPVEYADFITSTTHKTLRGPRGAFILCKEKYKKIIDKSVMPGIQGGPFMNVIAAKAVCFKLASKPEFKLYQEQVIKNSKIMASEFQKLNYKIVSNGTDNHLFIIDLRNKNLKGKEAEEILEKANINVSRSLIPYDIEKPTICSGIRIGTAAITTRGFKEANCIKLVHLIDEALKINETHDNNIKDKVKSLLSELT